MKTNNDLYSIRDYFLDAEKPFSDFVEKECDNEIYNLREQYTNEELFNASEKLMEMVETGQVKQEDMEKVEAQLAVLFIAIQEKRKSLIKTLGTGPRQSILR